MLDSDNVDDPALAKVGSTYVMWYSGTPEDGGPPAIFTATSTNGTTWTGDDSSKKRVAYATSKAPAKRALFRAKIGADKEHLANLSRSVRA